MTKRRRGRVLFAVALFSAVVGLLFYLAARENPDYVRAAKLLPEAKQRAREAFGSLTWEEYRAEKGIVHQNDSAEWRRIDESIPDDLRAFRTLDPPEPERFGQMFVANQAWLLGLLSETENLAIRQPYPEYLIEFTSLPVRNLMRVLAIGIIGAADVGDIDALTQMARTAWRVLEKGRVEPDSQYALMIVSGRIAINSALLTAVVRNTEDERLLVVARELIADSPSLPKVRDALAGDARSNREYFKLLLDEGPDELNKNLNIISDEDLAFGSPTPASSTLWEEVREYLSGLANDNVNTRKTGKHAFGALEARLWEVHADLLVLSEEVLPDHSSLEERLKRFDEGLEARSDLSYEFVKRVVYSYRVRLFMQPEVSIDLALLALTILAEHRTLDSLPDALTADDLIPDPFGDGPMIYRKTPTGFVLYTIYEDGVDGGFAPRDSRSSQYQNAYIGLGQQGADFGIFVNYQIPKAPPAP